MATDRRTNSKEDSQCTGAATVENYRQNASTLPIRAYCVNCLVYAYKNVHRGQKLTKTNKYINNRNLKKTTHLGVVWNGANFEL